MNKLIKMLYKLNESVEHSGVSKWIKPIVHKLGLGHLARIIELKTEDKEEVAKRCEEYKRFYDQHEDMFRKIPPLLEDDFSRHTFERLLEFRKTWDTNILKDITIGSEYYQKDIFGPVEDEVFIDGGAYIGDSIERYINDFATGGYKKIYAWEPDKANIERLKKNTSKYDNVEVIPCGMWKEKTVLCFDERGNMGSKLIGDQSQSVQKVEVDSIDNVCARNKVTFIKMDIEGSELAALQGAIGVITRDKPRMAICLYHKPEDMYEVPLWIKQTVPEYKLYIRHHGYRRATSTVLYATL